MLDTVERAGVKIEKLDRGVLKVSFEKDTIMTIEATEYFFDYFEGQEDDGLTILADIRNLKYVDIKVRKFILKRNKDISLSHNFIDYCTFAILYTLWFSVSMVIYVASYIFSHTYWI